MKVANEKRGGKRKKKSTGKSNSRINGALFKNVRKKRSCLMCGEMFISNGPFNRRCSKCSRLVDLGKGSLNNPTVYRFTTPDSEKKF